MFPLDVLTNLTRGSIAAGFLYFHTRIMDLPASVWDAEMPNRTATAAASRILTCAMKPVWPIIRTQSGRRIMPDPRARTQSVLFADRAQSGHELKIAIVGTGISGLSAAWLLAQHLSVTVYEAADRVGGHSHTEQVDIGAQRIGVDTGFMVYNEPSYPNLTALFAALDVPTAATDMSFAVSLDGGALEYAGSNLAGLLAQPSNLFKPRFWSMLNDLLRFYRVAPGHLPQMGEMSLDAYLDWAGFGRPFRQDHLYPMAAAIWSTPAALVGAYPAAAFVRFCENHGLLKLQGRPVWRTVCNGSQAYVSRLTRSYSDRILTGTPVVSIVRDQDGVVVRDAKGGRRRFDHVVVATHADHALALLTDPTSDEQRLLSTFSYAHNEAVLHTDIALMPKRRAAWASWNYLSQGGDNARQLSVTYWMNRLQPLGVETPLFVTLNPFIEPRSDTVLRRENYAHPMSDLASMRAQQELWTLQGRNNTWFCGSYFGAGFHEDGLQSGLAVAEDLGGYNRPWTVANDSARIARRPLSQPLGYVVAA